MSVSDPLFSRVTAQIKAIVSLLHMYYCTIHGRVIHVDHDDDDHDAISIVAHIDAIDGVLLKAL